ncbi:MAG: endolytic transglycosylase MltG [Bacilli bacterium]|nr:endolytic transglycosylase MltG [Bacilli bacterium]
MKKTVRKFSVRKFLLFLLFLIIILISIVVGIYFYEIGPVSTKTKAKLISIEKGDNFYNISSKLKKNNLIKSEIFYKIYLKITKPNGLTVGDYELNETMSTQKIVEVLSDSKNQKIDTIKITFREGLNIRGIAQKIEEKANIKNEEFINKVSDKEYIKSIQKDYWFLTDEIYNDKIYYPLEGYLFPDTYEFEKKDISSEKIIKKILDNTKEKLNKYKEQFKNNEMSIHQVLTLASLVEQEAVTKEDRALVAGVFYNRLKTNMSLGSDVTTYYAAKKSLTESLTREELTECNGYNTRCLTMKGLPVGPIANPSITSIEAALNPTQNEYYYFVADTSKKVYFNKTINEHNQTIAKLKKEGKWAA